MRSLDRRWSTQALVALLVFSGVLLLATRPTAAQEGNIHGTYAQLAGPFETPQEVTDACLLCHRSAAGQVMGTTHWTWEHTDPETGQQLGKNNVINNYCVAVRSNEPRCTSCHIGYGYADPSFFETATTSDVDCLICHDTTGGYKKFPAGSGYPVLGEAKEFPAGSGRIWEPVDLVEVARNVGLPSRTNCGSCHFFGGGGDAVKHGDLDSTLADPSRDLDVHMAADGENFSCATCHSRGGHEIAGRLYGDEEPVSCEDCHTGETEPHQESEAVRGAESAHGDHRVPDVPHPSVRARAGDEAIVGLVNGGTEERGRAAVHRRRTRAGNSSTIRRRARSRTGSTWCRTTSGGTAPSPT